MQENTNADKHSKDSYPKSKDPTEGAFTDMKAVDVVTPVMKKVARYEKKRIHRYVFGFFVIIGLLWFLCGALVFHMWNEIRQQESYELLTVFGEDMEIIKEYWRDSLELFMFELSPVLLYGAIGILFVLVLIYLFTRSTRRIQKNKMKDISRYSS